MDDLKTYYEYMDEISPDELYDRLMEFGFISDKLPNIFDLSGYLSFSKADRVSNPSKRNKFISQYIKYNNIRIVNIPRILGIPTPMAYEVLCHKLKENWGEIQNHFKDKTNNQNWKVSKVHIRKMKETKSLFEMNYDNWMLDGTPELDILIGKKYQVSADISNCFPSIYTHALAWALIGKANAKLNQTN